jgi:transposase
MRDLECLVSALSASRHNSLIRAFYENLLSRGKPKKVALVACMQKMLVIVNAMAREGRCWGAGQDRPASAPPSL